MMTSHHKPLPLSQTLRDLALLRASDVSLSALLGATSAAADADAENNNDNNNNTNGDDDDDVALRRSYELVREARAAMLVLRRGVVDQQGDALERLERRLREVREGLGAAPQL